jgi:hypothetical protein
MENKSGSFVRLLLLSAPREKQAVWFAYEITYTGGIHPPGQVITSDLTTKPS